MADEIKDVVRNFILTEFLPGEAPENLTDDVPLISGGILDSIATLKLILYIEERLGVVIEAHEANKDHLDTVADIVNLVRSKKS